MTTTVTQKCIPGCNRPPSGQGTYPYLCWGHTPEEQDCYPVIVEYTQRHVVWVPADDQDAALRGMQNEPYEKTDDQETLFESGITVKSPANQWDWQDVYEGGYYHPYGELDCNAHVETHRLHLSIVARAHLRATVEDEDREIAAGRLATEDRRTCPVCPAWLEPGHADTSFHIASQRMGDLDAGRAVETLPSL